ncbi:hypothetical protein CDL12_02076 [Handroanthus impetiginosus]|uniref:C3H1-type domain-containing protein n=1 Tax=Handroanthus impetiginosus TaxID=429701 RepID=A0A2G9I5Y3_9LAMI|nr:hypothetical protein CDL12_02076 [Handroanthus impetiginosus]
MDFGRKRGRPDAAFHDGGGFKKSKEAMDSFTTGVGSKSKPCKKFFSTSGCTYGDACHYQHYAPGYSAHAQLANLGGNDAVPAGRNAGFTDSPAPTMKTKLCNKINTPEGCRYGDKCHFAHSEMEFSNRHEGSRMMGPVGGFSQRLELSQRGLPMCNFGASATAKISIDASLAGPIIGKNGVNSKQICRETGVKLYIKDHDTDPNQKNIELEGSFDQIKEASSMVRHLIIKISASGRAEKSMPPPNHYKRKMCENFYKGSCNFGERCHFAHSVSELRNPLA